METPLAQQIERAALDARITLSAILERSGVSRSTFYRSKRGVGGMHPLTVARLQDAIAELKAERAK